MFRSPTQVDPKGHVTLLVIWTLIALVPTCGLFLWSFLTMQDFKVVWEPTLQAYRDVLASGRWEVTVRTLRIAAIVTAIEMLLAVPFALWLTKGCRSIGLRTLLLGLLTIPFFLSLASRTIVWRGLLGTGGPVNTLLLQLGLIDAPLDWLLFSEFSVILGLIGPYFPSMVFPLFLAFSLIDDEVLNASKDLGASPAFTFAHVILPLALPGIGAGIIFTFVPMIGDPVVPNMLGGGNTVVLSASVESLLRVMNYSVAAALSVLMLLLLIVSIGVMALLSTRFTMRASA